MPWGGMSSHPNTASQRGIRVRCTAAVDTWGCTADNAELRLTYSKAFGCFHDAAHSKLFLAKQERVQPMYISLQKDRMMLLYHTCKTDRIQTKYGPSVLQIPPYQPELNRIAYYG
jgi:hypothetical protein